MDLPGLRPRGGGILIWETGDPETWEWIPREDPAQGSQWIPRPPAEDLGVDPRRESGAGGLGSLLVPSPGGRWTVIGDWELLGPFPSTLG